MPPGEFPVLGKPYQLEDLDRALRSVLSAPAADASSSPRRHGRKKAAG
jgi:hypothetical protein